MTHNEKIQEVLTQAVKTARARNIPKRAHDYYCAMYAAGRYADVVAQTEYPLPNSERLKRWMQENASHVYEVLANLDSDKLAALLDSPKLLRAYFAKAMQEEMDYQNPPDEPFDTTVEDDMRARVKDHKLDEISLC